MATANKSQEWIDRYVREVGRQLPARKQTDTEMEIRSLIEDEVEARVADGAARDEATVLDVLHQFGRPQQIAARYGAPQMLIGPALYPVFLNVLRIVLGVVTALAIFGVAIAAGVDGERPTILETVGGLFATLLQAGGMVVLVFALVERANRAELQREWQKPWDPRTLPAVEERDRVKVGEMLVGIGFSVAILIGLNFYLDRLGGYYVVGEGWRSIAIFGEAFFDFVPWLTLWWGSELLLSIVVLIRGRWQTWSRLVQLAINLLAAGILLQMLTGGPLAAWAPLEPVFKVTLAIALVAALFDAAKTAYRLVVQSGRSSPPRQVIT